MGRHNLQMEIRRAVVVAAVLLAASVLGMAPDSPSSEIQPLAQEQPFTQREVSTETDLLELGEEVVKKDKNFYHAAADACACSAAAQIKKVKPISAKSSCFTVSI